MNPATLVDLVRRAADQALSRHGLDPAVLPRTITVERPPSRAQGDYATSVALRVAGQAGVAPRTLAAWLAEALAADPAVRCAEVAGPGFVNLRLTPEAHAETIRTVLSTGSRFGTETAGAMLGDRLGWTVPERSWPAAAQVRYAHARMAALARNAADFGITPADAVRHLAAYLAGQDEGDEGEDTGTGKDVGEQERELVRALAEFPCVVAAERAAAEEGQPHRLRRYLERLATASHALSDTCRVLPMGDEDPGPHHAARLALCQAIRQVLANGLRLLGMSAPERM